MKRLAVSNIAWPTSDEDKAHALLRAHGVNHIEVAPTMIWPGWEAASLESALKIRRKLEGSGFCVPSFQAIFFGKDEINMFRSPEERRQALAHIEWVARLAKQMGATRLVFGSPRTRYRLDVSPAEAFDMSIAFFREAAERCEANNATLCLEPNPPDYRCNFVTRCREGVDLVQSVSHPNFRLVLDTACLFLAGDDPTESIAESAEVLAHFHISEPFLADFSDPSIDHRMVAKALDSVAYSGVLTIEMRPSQSPLESLRLAVDNVGHWYF